MRARIRDIAAVRVRYGYLRITALLKREGWQVSPKRAYRIYKEEGLEVRTRKRKKCASALRVPLPCAEGSGQRWAMDFICDRLADGRQLRVLTVVDHFDRSCPVLYADHSIGAGKVADALTQAAQRLGGLPEAITVDNGPEFAGNVLDACTYDRGVKLDFTRPGKPTENGTIESFNGKFRDELLNTEIFFLCPRLGKSLNNSASIIIL